MYTPRHFAEHDPDVVRELIADAPLATLVTRDAEGGFTANHIPMFLDVGRGEHGTLVGHVARANPVWRTPGPALAVFAGPDAYISPNWYASKLVDGRVVPTWNYTAVHAHGTLVAFDDPAITLGIVTRLTDLHEAGRAEPWHVHDAPGDYIDKMLMAIVGIEITVTRFEAKSKLSQNRSDADRAAVAAGVRAEGNPLADRIR